MVKKLIKKAFHFGFETSYRLTFAAVSKLFANDPLVTFALDRMVHIAEEKGISMYDLSVSQLCWAISELLRNKEIVGRIPDDIIWNHRLMMRIFVRARLYDMYMADVLSAVAVEMGRPTAFDNFVRSN